MTSAVLRHIDTAKWSSLLALLVVLWGCDKPSADGSVEPDQPTADQPADDGAQEGADSKQASPGIVYADGPTPGPDTVLAKSGEIEVTLSDFESAMQRSMLVAPKGTTEVPEENLAAPHLQINAVRNLLSSKILAHEAAERGLEATQSEKIAALEDESRLAPFAPLLAGDDDEPAELAKRGLGRDDLDQIATDLVLRQKLRDRLLENIDEDSLWETYAAEHDRVGLLVVSARNTPTMEEISNFIAQSPDRIEEHFEENKDRYRTPKMVRMVRLLPADRSQADPAKLEEAAKRLGEEESPEEIAEDLGLSVDANGLLVRGENKRAFSSEEGQSGYQMRGPRGAYAWKVTGFRESKEATLTESLKREIASELLRQQSVVPSRGAKVEEAIDTMGELPTTDNGEVGDEALDELIKGLEADGLDVVRTELFAKNKRGYIAGVGLAEEFAKRAFDLTLDSPVVEEPILSRQKVWGGRLLERELPSRERFEREKSAYKDQFDEQMSKRVLEDFVSHYQDKHDTELDLNPLRIKYGTLQKD